MDSKFEIFWTEESLKNLDDILEYLNFKWSQKEVVKFKTKLSKHIEIISKFPYLFPASPSRPELRKAVLGKQTTILYQIKNSRIFILYLFDTRQDPDKIKEKKTN